MPLSPNQAPNKYGPAASRRWSNIANYLVQQTGEYDKSSKKAKAFTRAAAGRKLDRKTIAERGVP